MRNPTKEELAQIKPLDQEDRRTNLAHQRASSALSLAVEGLRIECGDVPPDAVIDSVTGEWVLVTVVDGQRRKAKLL